MISIKRIWVSNFLPRRSLYGINLNSITFFLLISISLMLLVLNDTTHRANETGEHLQKVQFIDTAKKTVNTTTVPTKTFRDNINVVFNSKEIRTQSETNEVPVGKEVQKTKMILVDEELPEDNEDDFDLNEEFVPPTANKKLFKNVGNFIQSYFGGNTKEGQNESPIKDGLGSLLSNVLSNSHNSKDSPMSNIMSAFKMVKNIQSLSSKLKGSKDDRDHSLMQEKVKADQDDITRSKPHSKLSNNKNTDNAGNALNNKEKKASGVGSSWIEDALKDLSRNESAIHVQKIYDFMLRKNIRSPDTKCSNIDTIGNTNKGQFNPDYAQQQCADLDFSGAFRKGCIVYAFGIHGSWDFENTMAGKGCRVWVFDANLKKKPSEAHSTIKFSNVGLGVKDEVKIVDNTEVQFHTLETVLTKLNHNNTLVSYVKINFRGEEWPILDQIITNSSFVANNILQLGLTTNLHTALIDHRLYKQYLNTLNRLKTLGFLLFSSNKVFNPNDIYAEPFLDNRKVSLTNYLAYIMT